MAACKSGTRMSSASWGASTRARCCFAVGDPWTVAHGCCRNIERRTVQRCGDEHGLRVKEGLRRRKALPARALRRRGAPQAGGGARVPRGGERAVLVHLYAGAYRRIRGLRVGHEQLRAAGKKRFRALRAACTDSTPGAAIILLLSTGTASILGGTTHTCCFSHTSVRKCLPADRRLVNITSIKK